MQSAPPYRVPETPASPPEEGTEADAEHRIGARRSSHRGRTFFVALPGLVLVFLAVILGVALFPSSGRAALLIPLPMGLIGAVLFVVGLVRSSGLRVDVHAQGLVVERRGSRDAVPFDEVSEVWWHLDSHGAPLFRIVAITDLRLVDRAGRVHKVSLRVAKAAAVIEWVNRQCSMPLCAEAMAAVREGEALTFGRVRVDARAIAQGRKTLPWSDLRLVRFQPGRVAFFRRQTVFPSMTVTLDEVPHPPVFLHVLRELAQRSEDDPRRS